MELRDLSQQDLSGTDYENINPLTLENLKNYVTEHVPVGHFLEAVLTNNLRNAVAHADPDNLNNLRAIVRFCHWEIPGRCWGSPEAYDDWVRNKAN